MNRSPARPSTDQIERLLLSSDPREIAWGAYYAAASRDSALEQDLLQVAEQWQPLPQRQAGDPTPIHLDDDQEAARDATAAVLDALIQRNVQVPADTLGNLAADFQNYVAILLSRLPLDESQELSFKLFRDPPFNGDTLQYISAALLARNPPPGFAAELFSGVQVYAQVDIVSPQTPPHGFGRAGCWGPPDISKPRADWPLFGMYSFSRESSSGALAVLTVPDRVYAVRVAVSNRYPGGGRNVVLAAEDRRSFIAFVLGVQPENIEWKTYISGRVLFASEAQFEIDLRDFVDELEEQYRATAVDLADHNLITPSEEQEARPSVALHWVDSRGKGYEPIPKPAFLPSKVTWTGLF